MGSKWSKLETVIEGCLSDFPENERTHVTNLFDRLSKGPTGGSGTTEEHNTAEDSAFIDPQDFDAHFGPLLPPSLLTCFRATMQLYSVVPELGEDTLGTNSVLSSGSNAPISKYGWIMTIHQLAKTNIEELAGLAFALQTYDTSLESFVSNVTRAVMAFWLAGELKSWNDVPEDDTKATTEFLLTHYLESSKKGNSLDDLDLALGSMKIGTESNEDKALKEWLEAARKRDSEGKPSSKELNRSDFVAWYIHTVEYQLLFTILIQNLFLGPSTLEDAQGKRIKLGAEAENKLCQKNYIAPRIRGGIDAAPHFSRLLTVSEFFQLRYALPTPVYDATSGSQGPPKKSGKEPEAHRMPPMQLLFSSKTSGASFSTLVQRIMFQGPTLMIMKDEDGYIFGAYADQDWAQNPKFYGTDRGFLFTIRPNFRIYRPSGVNDNFQYLGFNTKTLPNGIGFGGQFNYFGLWLGSDFQTGQSAAEPLCSTYQSPQMSKQQDFKLDEMEVWQIHPSLIERDEDPKYSAMDTHADAVALLEMANRKMYSKDVRAPEGIYDSD
ncbi:TLD-domain-containing protein [Mortierella sp. GBAus27b]|nr:TLD-domain-containing protein [Mortierella sp. GBAus27b]